MWQLTQVSGVVTYKIGMHTQQVEEQQSQSYYHSSKYQQSYFLPIGEDIVHDVSL